MPNKQARCTSISVRHLIADDTALSVWRRQWWCTLQKSMRTWLPFTTRAIATRGKRRYNTSSSMGTCDKTCRHIVPLRLRGNVCKKPDLSFHVRKRGHPGQRRTTNMHCGCYNTSSRIPTLAHGKWPPAKTSARRQWSAPSKGTTTIHTKYPSTKRFFRRTLTVGKTFACG